MEENNSFFFVFRPNNSTNSALIEITEQIRKACGKGLLFAYGVYLDLKKAFDTVNYNILLTKLNYYGIKSSVNYWFRSFIKHWKQYTSVIGNNSNSQEITHGVL